MQLGAASISGVTAEVVSTITEVEVDAACATLS